MMNSVNIIGRLTKDVELRYSESGLAIANIRVAVDKGLAREKREQFERENKPTADFLNVVLFGGTAEAAAQYLGKGRLASFSGRLQSGSYDAEDGTRRYTTDIVANSMDILEWPEDGETPAVTPAPTQNQPGSIENFQPTGNDDIPF